MINPGEDTVDYSLPEVMVDLLTEEETDSFSLHPVSIKILGSITND